MWRLHFEWKKDLVSELQKEIAQFVKYDRKSRVYIIYPSAQGTYRGKFLKGGRKSAPWTGFATVDSQEEDADE